MDEELGYVRVVNVRADDEDFRAAPGERVIPMDRTSNPLMGNRHDMKSKSMAERDRVVAAHAADLEADIKRKGPMYQAMMAIAFDIVDRGDKVAIQCFCAPKPCHLDLVAAHITKMVGDIRQEMVSAPVELTASEASARPSSLGKP